uniref:Uncharacterized protein n=1 Tax=viral metagenome TaxID=1070528 RepID=A0A6C0KC07_9ZZZZ
MVVAKDYYGAVCRKGIDGEVYRSQIQLARE